MCLVLVAYNVHPSYRLVLAANRDEFFERPSSSADFWDDRRQVIAGRDLKGGGTWIGVTKKENLPLSLITVIRLPGKTMLHRVEDLSAPIFAATKARTIIWIKFPGGLNYTTVLI